MRLLEVNGVTVIVTSSAVEMVTTNVKIRIHAVATCHHLIFSPHLILFTIVNAIIIDITNHIGINGIFGFGIVGVVISRREAREMCMV